MSFFLIQHRLHLCAMFGSQQVFNFFFKTPPFCIPHSFKIWNRKCFNIWTVTTPWVASGSKKGISHCRIMVISHFTTIFSTQNIPCVHKLEVNSRQWLLACNHHISLYGGARLEQLWVMAIALHLWRYKYAWTILSSVLQTLVNTKICYTIDDFNILYGSWHGWFLFYVG